MSRATTGITPEPETSFLASLPLVERLLAIQARRHGLSEADAEDFAGWAKARLIDDDYAVFRKFDGRSAIATYLSVVLANLVHDYKNSVWGRWRPSAAAKRLGPLGIRLDELLHRDGYPLREAVQLLRTAGAPRSEAELAQLAAQLPVRRTAREVPLDVVDESASALLSADDPSAAVDQTRIEALECAVREAVASLPAEDALILRMRFWDGLKVSDIARTLRLEQMPLYRRIESLGARLRTALGARGIDRALVSELLHERD